MKWSYRIARIAGIEVRVHITFFLLLAYYAWSFYKAGSVAGVAAGLHDAFLYGVVFTLLIFLCVLLHEFGHAFAARYYGIKTPDITLLPIGGLARLERMPRVPLQELVIAIAGPAVNVLIAALLYAVLQFLPLGGEPDDSLLAGLLWINLMLIKFNAIPAFPMDGGRVLRALLAFRLDFRQATRIAARVGQGIALVFAIVSFLPPPQGNPMLLLIAMFVFTTAQMELMMVNTQRTAPIVSSVMFTQFDTIPYGGTLAEALALISRDTQPAFPLVEPDLKFRGLISREDLLGARINHLPSTGILSLAHTMPTLKPETPLQDAGELMARLQEPVLPVTNSSGQIVGLLVLAAPLQEDNKL